MLTCTDHTGWEELAVKPTWIRRFLTLLALKTTARFFKRDGCCIPISRHMIVKTGPWVHLTEAATMQFIAENTSIPVPKVYCAFVHKNRAYIVMERVQGTSLASVIGKCSEESSENIFTQLKDMFEELRALEPPPGTGVHSFAGGSLYDSRIARCQPRLGPFKTIQNFHLWLRDGLEPSEDQPKNLESDEWEDIKEMVKMQDGPWPEPVFTHGDMNPSNIIVQGDKVVGIIDWEFAGWYPSYWEYTSAYQVMYTKTQWQGMIGNFLDPYTKQLKMERTRQRWWGEI
ncbi:serine/threonine protein kinase [Nannizzia gypsea CBS 118893]|uniref:Serine/threonine protein kinase n=1 Tax=Arthroderma gypseum (strain ATCC MYA-4604 / CBS 118893) TaxID=535722 RepID=E4UUS9_ARTGP|nr:serine/threonine protein kinase [Nannizzia gypsea CBS 118893]EFR01046.1 serine/threonine protein kinase [Nannizzia gypsea CBS 118893]